MTDDDLKDLVIDNIHYDPMAGSFTWIKRRGSKAAGSDAGYVEAASGYHRIKIGPHKMAAHRIAWLLMMGDWPTEQVDHINRNPTDNRWSNLRQATASQNSFNQKIAKNNKTGYKGVSICSSTGKYRASIKVKGKTINLGSYHTAEEASDVYNIKSEEYFREFSPTW